jgi:hypothetical protein
LPGGARCAETAGFGRTTGRYAHPGNGVRFRNQIITGVGGKQIIAEDPSGNPVELFEPVLPEAKLQ